MVTGAGIALMFLVAGIYIGYLYKTLQKKYDQTLEIKELYKCMHKYRETIAELNMEITKLNQANKDTADIFRTNKGLLSYKKYIRGE